MPKPIYVTTPLMELDATNGKTITVLDPEYLISTKVEVYDVDGTDGESTIEALITTPRLLIFSTGHSKCNRGSHLRSLASIYASADTMSQYKSEPLNQVDVVNFYSSGAARWDAGNMLSSFVIETKDGAIVGQSSMDNTGIPGVANYSIMIGREFQEEGYDIEATVAHTYYWAPFVKELGGVVDGAELESVSASVRAGSINNTLFSKLGFDCASSSQGNAYNLLLARAEETASYTRKFYKLGLI